MPQTRSERWRAQGSRRGQMLVFLAVVPVPVLVPGLVLFVECNGQVLSLLAVIVVVVLAVGWQR